VSRQIHDACHGGKLHLLREHQHQRFEQQREAVELADLIRLDQPHRAVRQAHARHAHFKVALVLEEIQVAQPLDLRVMHRVLAGEAGIGKAASKS
jgi:hypothetical protein